jgi:molybdenum cofactor biosynthesis enzyme MoaA
MKHKINLLEVYITNVCNLSCRGCNRFNNYNFKGHQLWADHADEYET